MRLPRLSFARILPLLVAIAASTSCGTQDHTSSHAASIGDAQQQMPFRIRVPAPEALPPEVALAPVVTVTKDRVPKSVASSAGVAFIFSVEISYQYRDGSAPARPAPTSPVTILEYQNLAGDDQPVLIPAGGGQTVIGGRTVIARQEPSPEILWSSAETSFDVTTRLSWDETVQIFLSMVDDQPSPGSAVPPKFSASASMLKSATLVPPTGSR